MKKISGSIVAIVTPMNKDCSLDTTSLDKLIEWHIRAGTDGIVVVGTTGESPTVDFSEHVELIKVASEIIDGRVPVLAGTGANSTEEAISLTKEAELIGVDACLQVTPYYNKPSQKGLIEHFSKIANATKLPVILYNVPGRTVADLNNESVKEYPNTRISWGLRTPRVILIGGSGLSERSELRLKYIAEMTPLPQRLCFVERMVIFR